MGYSINKCNRPSNNIPCEANMLISFLLLPIGQQRAIVQDIEMLPIRNGNNRVEFLDNNFKGFYNRRILIQK